MRLSDFLSSAMNTRDFFLGRVDLRASGGSPERLISKMTSSRIPPNRPIREPDGDLLFSITPSGFKKLPKCVRLSGCRIKIVRKRGLPFILHSLFKRPGLASGFIFSLALLFVLSRFIWSVEVSGCPRDDEIKLRAMLSDFGLRPGVLSSSCDADSLKLRLLVALPEFDWTAVNITGSRARVQAVSSPEFIDTEYLSQTLPADFVAAKAGYIVRCEIFKGESCAVAGAAVAEGDIIAAAEVHEIIPGTREPSGIVRLVHAYGDAWAEVTGSARAIIPAERLVKRYKSSAGSVRARNIFYFAENSIKILKSYSISTSCCDKICGEINFSLPFGGAPLPFSLRRERYAFYTLEREEVSPDEARERLEALLRNSIEASGDRVTIGEISFEMTGGDGFYSLSADYTTLEQIGRVVMHDISASD